METKTSLNHDTPPAAKPLLAAGVVFFDGNNSVRIQSANYIEDGWYIDIIGNEITLWEMLMELTLRFLVTSVTFLIILV